MSQANLGLVPFRPWNDFWFLHWNKVKFSFQMSFVLRADGPQPRFWLEKKINGIFLQRSDLPAKAVLWAQAPGQNLEGDIKHSLGSADFRLCWKQSSEFSCCAASLGASSGVLPGMCHQGHNQPATTLQKCNCGDIIKSVLLLPPPPPPHAPPSYPALTFFFLNTNWVSWLSSYFRDAPLAHSTSSKVRFAHI